MASKENRKLPLLMIFVFVFLGILAFICLLNTAVFVFAFREIPGLVDIFLLKN